MSPKKRFTMFYGLIYMALLGYCGNLCLA